MKKRACCSRKWLPVLLPLVLDPLFSSCNTVKNDMKDFAIESIVDPKTGTRVFIREDDSQPYSINIEGIVKARKNLKKKKLKEILDNY